MAQADVWGQVGAAGGAIAALVALASAWYSRQSAIAATHSATAAERAVALTQSVRLLLTNDVGGEARIRLQNGVLRLWVTNGGQATVIITRIDLVARVQVPAWWALPFLPNRRGRGYARIRYLGRPSGRELKGGAADRGANVAEITMPLSEASPPQRWDQGAFDAPDPAQAILAANTGGAHIAIEIRTAVTASGFTEWHTIPIGVYPSDAGKYAGRPYFAGEIKKGTIIDRDAFADR